MNSYTYNSGNSYIYISCLENEQNLPQVAALCNLLRFYHCRYAFAGDVGCRFKQCVAFVVVAGPGYDGATWLMGELYDAFYLSKSHPNHLPRFYGLNIGGSKPQDWPQQVPVLIHWLDTEQDYFSLLANASGEQPAR